MYTYMLAKIPRQNFVSAPTAAHRKHIIALLMEHKIICTFVIIIWVNKDGCGEQYKFSKTS